MKTDRMFKSLLFTVLVGLFVVSNGFSETAKPTVAAKTEGAKDSHMSEKATFAAGCFWGVEATFRQIKGVLSTQVGYTGGGVDSPSYKQVCSDTTGHAEAVEVTYDPSQVKYTDLLKVFWENHDPTQVNRQGPDHGTQYRTAIFYHSPEQQRLAEESKRELDAGHRFSRPIATRIVPAVEFWRAEEYHQQYLEKRGLSTCHIK